MSTIMMSILILISIIITLGVFIGLICLQVRISKNDKRGKFVIPIVFFILPIFAIIFGMFSLVGVRSVMEIQEESVYTYVDTDPDYDESELYEDEYTDDLSEDSDGTLFAFVMQICSGAIIVVIFASFPCAIATLMIELVYRSKRKRKLTDEQVIDIKNL